MKLFARYLSFTLLFLLLQRPWAQDGLAIGQWRTHLSYRAGKSVTQTPTEAVYSTGSAIIFVNKQERSTRRLTRADGLSQTDIKFLRYHAPTLTLIIVYENSVIDLYRPDGSIATLKQIDNFNFSGGDNSVNDIFIDDSNQILLAAGYGISLLDLDREIFLSTTFFPIPVRAAARYEGAFFAATDEGLYRVAEDGVNINDFTTWALLGSERGLPEDYASTALTRYRGQLYLGVNEDIYRWQDGRAELFYDLPAANWRLAYLTAEGTHLLAGFRCLDISTCADRGLYIFNETGLVRSLKNNCTSLVAYAVEDERSFIWFADELEPIRVLEGLGIGDCLETTFLGPETDQVWKLAFHDKVLWVATGAVSPSLTPNLDFIKGFYRLQDGQWTSFNERTRPELRADGNKDNFLVVTDVQPNPVTGKVYAASWLEGLAEYDPATDELRVFDETNSALQVSTGAGAGRVRVGGLSVAEDGTLWMVNQLAAQNRPIVSLSPAGDWRSYGSGCQRNGLFELAIDQNGYKWALSDISSGGGLVVFDEGDPAQPNDDRCKLLTTTNSALASNELRSIAVDLDGEVWVGTTQGVTLFNCGTDLFDNNCPGVRPIVTRNDFAALLLETEEVLAIAVDGANRKWIGTGSGVFLLSPDGQEEIHFFNTDNSPLLDNTVRTIAIDDASGEVFFGTDKGIISYRGDATAGGRVNRAAIKVFPNPVRPEYAGPIAIQGLARDANVKITDLSGKLVYETRALGGQAIWDGRDYTGRKAQTGIYLVFSTTNARNLGFDNPDAAVAKIVFIN